MPHRIVSLVASAMVNDNYFCRRIASPDLLPGEHGCLRIPATEGRHDRRRSVQQARQELVAAVAERYQRSTPAERGRILDEFVALTGYHRKHAIRVLNGSSAVSTVRRGRSVCVRRSRDGGAGRAVGGIGPRVREASEGVAADPGAGTRAARARDHRTLLTRPDIERLFGLSKVTQGPPSWLNVYIRHTFVPHGGPCSRRTSCASS